MANLEETRKKLEAMVGSQCDLYPEGRTTSIAVIVRRNGGGFVAVDEVGERHELRAEDATIYGRTIFCGHE